MKSWINSSRKFTYFIALTLCILLFALFLFAQNMRRSSELKNGVPEKTPQSTTDGSVSDWQNYSGHELWDLNFRYPQSLKIHTENDNEVSFVRSSPSFNEDVPMISVSRDKNPSMNFEDWFRRKKVQDGFIEVSFSGLEARQDWTQHSDGRITADTYFFINGFMYQFSLRSLSDDVLPDLYQPLLGTVQVVRENIVVSTNSDGDWKEYRSHGIRFHFPSKLQVEPHNVNELTTSDGNYPLQSLSMSVVSPEFIQANESPSSYVDGISIEFPTTFTVELPIQPQTYGTRTGVEKRYLYDNSIRRRSFFLIQHPKNQHYYLFAVHSLNTVETDKLLYTIYSSIQFE